MGKCERCRQLENELVMVCSILDAIHRIINGQEVSDFELSFPAVREVADIITSQQVNPADKGKPTYCGGCGYTHTVDSKCPIK